MLVFVFGAPPDEGKCAAKTVSKILQKTRCAQVYNENGHDEELV